MTKAAKRKTLKRSRTRFIVRSNGMGEVGEEVERAGDEDTAWRPRKVTSALPRDGGISRSFDMLEVRFGAGGEFLLRERPGVRRRRGDEGVAEHRERAQHVVDGLVLEDRREDHVAARAEARQQVADP